MKNLKIGYFADGPWAHKAFEKLVVDKSIDFGFIVPRIGTVDNTLKQHASTFNIPYFPNTKINSDQFLKEAASFNCDLFVSMSFDQIFRKAIINLPSQKTINCHAGKLPFYRGRNVLNWVLINDEKEFGITIHYIDEGIDTGDIILQRTFAISDNDDYKLLLDLAYKECASILYDAIKKIQTGKFKPIPQNTIHPLGFYCGRRKKGDEIIDWNQTSRQIFNFIRAICNPGPKAHSTLKGEVLKINNARLIMNAPNYTCTIGEIVGKTEQGYIVKTADSTIEIFDLEPEQKLRIGDRLGS